MTGLAKPCMSIHPIASPTFCLVSIEVSSLTVTSDCSCLVIKRFRFYRNLLLFFEFWYYPYLKDSNFIGIFYCFSNFGTVLIIIIIIIIKRFRILRNLLLLKDSEFFGIFYCFSNFGTILIIIIILFYRTDAIGIANLQNRITFSHQTQLICGPLSDNVQCAFWCWSGLPFWI